MSRNCPDNYSVKSSRQGPPGKSMYSLELVPQTGTDSEETAEIVYRSELFVLGIQKS